MLDQNAPSLVRSALKLWLLPAVLILAAQGAVLHVLSIPEKNITIPELGSVPAQLGGWKTVSEEALDPAVQEYLKPDSYILRNYANAAQGSAVNVFVAYFKSLQSGYGPHSPSVCLPGSGWTPLESSYASIDVGGEVPIQVNRYVVAHGEERSLVLYWYQSRDRAIASEYTAKFWVVVDAMRLNRTDTALVRVVVPIVGRDEAAADKSAADFVRSFYGTLRQYLPA